MAEDLRSLCGHSRNVRLKTSDGQPTVIVSGDVLTCRTPSGYLRVTRKNPNSSNKRRTKLFWDWDGGKELSISKLRLKTIDQFEELCHLIGAFAGLEVKIIFRKSHAMGCVCKCRFE